MGGFPRVCVFFLGALGASSLLASGCNSSDGNTAAEALAPDGSAPGGSDGAGGSQNGSGGSNGGKSGGGTPGAGGSSNGGATANGGKPGSGGTQSTGGASGDGGTANTGGSGGDDPGPAPTQKCDFTPDQNGFFSLTSAKSDYWVRLPPGFDVNHQSPERLVVGIHGCGDDAKNFCTWAVAPWDSRDTQDYIALSVGGRDKACWTMNTDADLVNAAIDHVRSCFFVHQKKIVLAGYSSGGMLAYRMGLSNAAPFAGILIENSGASQGLGGGSKLDAALSSIAWKIHVAHTARLSDENFAIAGVRTDKDKLVAAGLPVEYREIAGMHSDTDTDWDYLLPFAKGWVAP